jgi:hypothetical protein
MFNFGYYVQRRMPGHWHHTYVWTQAFMSLGYMPNSGMDRPGDRGPLRGFRFAELLSRVVLPFCFHPSNVWEFWLLCHLCINFFLFLDILIGVQKYQTAALKSFSSWLTMILTTLSYAQLSTTCLLVGSVWSLLPISHWVVWFLIIELGESFMYFKWKLSITNDFSDILQMFSPKLWLTFFICLAVNFKG